MVIQSSENGSSIASINEQKKKTRWYTIEKSMLTSKLSFFLVNGKDSCYLPYMVLFLTSIGLSPSQAGLVNGTRFLGGMIGSPLLSAIADHNQAHGRVMVVITVCCSLLQVSQPFIPLLVKNSVSTNKTQNNLYPKNNIEESSNTQLLYLMIATNIPMMFFDGNFVSFTDSIVLQRIRLSCRKHDYGFQRLFGAIGFGGLSILSGVFITIFPKSVIISRYSPVFFLYTVIIFALMFSWTMINRVVIKKRKPKDEVKSEEKINTKLLLWNQIKKPKNFFFFLTVLFVGFIHGFYISFFSLLIKQLNGPDLLVGLSVAVGALSGIIFFCFSSRIIRLLGSIWMVMIACLFSWFLRFIGFYVIKEPWLILPIQLLCQGPGYALCIAGFVLHTKKVSPEPILTSMCSISNTLFFFIGSSLANICGGISIERYGLKNMWLVLSVACVSWCLVIGVFILSVVRRNTKEPDVLNNDVRNQLVCTRSKL